VARKKNAPQIIMVALLSLRVVRHQKYKVKERLVVYVAASRRRGGICKKVKQMKQGTDALRGEEFGTF